MRWLLFALLFASPASAGGMVCAFYDDKNVVQVVGILDHESDCEKLTDGKWREIRIPLSAFGGQPKTVQQKLRIAARMQEIVRTMHHAK